MIGYKIICIFAVSDIYSKCGGRGSKIAINQRVRVRFSQNSVYLSGNTLNFTENVYMMKSKSKYYF